MMRMANFLMLTAIVGIFAFGCGEQPNPVDSQNSPVSGLPIVQKITIPAGAVFESATLHIYAREAGNRPVNFHRITSAWDENVVTWNTFGGAYDGTIWATVTADVVGWKTVDLTSLFQAWLDGTYENYGFLLAYDEFVYPRTVFNSKEAIAYHPYLTYCYSIGGEMTCTDDYPIGDNHISELEPDANYGTSANLRVGWAEAAGGGLEKQSMMQFEIEPIVELAELGDFVWIDENHDGIQDEGEPGYPEATVELYNCDDVLLGTTLTNANGFYLFTGLIPGDYYVKFILPEGYVFTLQNIGDDALDSDADPTTGLDICTNLEGGESDMTHDAGLYLREMEGCTLTIGFWKNHAGFGPQDDVLSQYLPIWLGTEGGGSSLFVDNAAMAVDILKMKTYGEPSNGFTKLYAQLLGAKLNMAAGADYSDITGYLASADALLAMYDWNDWASFSRTEKKDVVTLMSWFDQYNNGLIGPGHCDDFMDIEE